MHQHEQGRSALIKDIRVNMERIFGAYATVPAGAWNDDAGRMNPTFRKLLCWYPQGEIVDQYPPLIYKDLVSKASGMFRHPGLIRVRLDQTSGAQ